MNIHHIDKLFAEHIDTIEKVRSQGELIQAMAQKVHSAFVAGHKLLLFGNGGSASDTQHIASEFVNRFTASRRALPAISLTTDTSVLTSIANDVGYQQLFSRQIEALGQAGDVAIAITTSDCSPKSDGHSHNIYQGIQSCKEKGIEVLGLLSQRSHVAKQLVDLPLLVPSNNTARI